jgi:hypothetical protein
LFPVYIESLVNTLYKIIIAVICAASSSESVKSVETAGAAAFDADSPA